jgi:hypothetical protein
MTEPDLDRTAVALCRAFAHGDQAGAKVILEHSDHLLLITALVAFCNRLGAEALGGSMPAWDAHLARCLAGTVD